MSQTNFRTPHIPVYRRIEQSLRTRLGAGEWRVGEFIPSRRRLASEFGVGLPTLDHAISALVADGTLQGEGRFGTRVVSHPERRTEFENAARSPIISTLPASLGIIAAFSLTEASIEGTGGGHVRLIVRAIEQSFFSGDRTTHVFNRYLSENQYVSPRDSLNALVGRSADALIVVTVNHHSDETQLLVAAVAEAGLPAVFVSAGEICPDIPHVFTDNRYGGYHAALHLLQRGYTPLTFVAPYEANWVSRRIAGAQQAADGHFAKVPLSVIWPERTEGPGFSETGFRSEMYEEAGYLAARASLKSIEHGCGIVAANDTVAYGVIRAAREAGLEPGDDFGIVGFDDFAGSCSLGLSSLHPPAEGLGAAAVRLLTQQVAGDSTEVQIRLKPNIVARTSTRPRTLTPSRKFAETAGMGIGYVKNA